MPSDETLQIVGDIREAQAGQALTEHQAKLYSQRLRLDMGREGLAGFVPGDNLIYFDEAIMLLECGLIGRRNDPSSSWANSVKRAAEILEWLSRSGLRPAGAPLHLLAGAAYQLAGYPAMAQGRLRYVPNDEPLSSMLRSFLQADFPSARESIRLFWHSQRVLEASDRIQPSDITAQTFQHIVMCISIICNYFRNGNNENVELALCKLEKLSANLLQSRDPYPYLLSQLTVASGRRFVESSVWPNLE